VVISAGRVAAPALVLLACADGRVDVWDEVLAVATALPVDELFVVLLPHAAVSSATAIGMTAARLFLRNCSSPHS
jgi:hypothetical protein